MVPRRLLRHVRARAPEGGRYTRPALPSKARLTASRRRDSNSINGELLLILVRVIRYNKLHGTGYKASQVQCQHCSEFTQEPAESVIAPHHTRLHDRVGACD